MFPDFYFYFSQKRKLTAHCSTVQLPIPEYLYTPHSVDLPMLRLADEDVMGYIPWGRGVYRDSIRFWDDDVVEVVKVWQELSQRTDHAGRKAFHSWKLRRREIIRKNLSVSLPRLRVSVADRSQFDTNS